MEAFVRAAESGRISAEVGLVVCNNLPEKAGVWQRVMDLNKVLGTDIEPVLINSNTHPGGPQERGQTLAEAEAICSILVEDDYDHVALMGYMKKVNGSLAHEWGQRADHATPMEARMSNTHPGILPLTADTWGVHASQAVLDAKQRLTAHTFHLVADGIDTGAVMQQNDVRVKFDDDAQTLFERVQGVEKAELPGNISDFLTVQRAFRAAE